MVKKILIALLALVILSAVASAEEANQNNRAYQLKEMVILSRHNIRSPLSGNGSVLAEITPYKWFEWTSAPSELSLRGGELETLMGQFFRKWLVHEGLMTENYIPAEGEFRFYANSMQRTIATAQYFSSGMLPVANVRIEHKFAPSKMDPVFTPKLNFVSENFRLEALKQIAQKAGVTDTKMMSSKINNELATLEKVLDFKKSKYAQDNNIEKFRTDNTELILEIDKEPNIKGDDLVSFLASDALTLQVYEEPSAYKAAFNHKLTLNQWEQIAYIKDFYIDSIVGAPIVAVNVAHPLLKVMSEELALNERKFTFLCGHDSNIASVLAALQVEEYSLPNSIEKKTPIGSKLVIQKWLGRDGVEYASLNLVYQTTDQLRQRTMLSLKTPPMIYQLKLKGLTQNADKLYLLSDLQKRFEEAITAYDELLDKDVQQAA